MSVNAEKVIKEFVKLRDEVAAIRERADKAIAERQSKMAAMEAYLLDRMQRMGASSIKTPNGTAFINKTDFAVVADWELFSSFAKEQDDFSLFEKRAAKMAVRDYFQRGIVVPGVNYGERISVSIRRPSNKE
ncbi:MAG: siphovirus Gp157 family protein [Candidatus Caldarchaeum sp.]